MRNTFTLCRNPFLPHGNTQSKSARQFCHNSLYTREGLLRVSQPQSFWDAPSIMAPYREELTGLLVTDCWRQYVQREMMVGVQRGRAYQLAPTERGFTCLDLGILSCAPLLALNFLRWPRQLYFVIKSVGLTLLNSRCNAPAVWYRNVTFHNKYIGQEKRRFWVHRMRSLGQFPCQAYFSRTLICYKSLKSISRTTLIPIIFIYIIHQLKILEEK